MGFCLKWQNWKKTGRGEARQEDKHGQTGWESAGSLWRLALRQCGKAPIFFTSSSVAPLGFSVANTK